MFVFSGPRQAAINVPVQKRLLDAAGFGFTQSGIGFSLDLTLSRPGGEGGGQFSNVVLDAAGFKLCRNLNPTAAGSFQSLAT